jgi:hypothetical protein
MQSIIPEHPHGALSLPVSGPEETRLRSGERLARLAALDPEQLPLALAFLAGYHPRVFDAALGAVEPCAGEDGPGLEPFCVRCGAPAGIFLAHGKEYRHYRGVLTATSKPRPYKADHALVIGWRPATDIPAAVAG